MRSTSGFCRLEQGPSLSMDVETTIQAFASAGNDLPQEAAEWALDHWEEAAPGLLGVLERFASGAERSDEAASAVFFILHLAGEKQDTRAFPLLCRLALDGEAVEAVLGDGITITLKQILISTYDGDLDTLKGLIEAAEADEYVRTAALAALAYLTATGRIARDETQTYLLRLYDTLQPQQESFVWSADSDDIGRAFRLMSATCSERSRPAVPIDVGRGGGAPAGRM